MNDNKLQVKTFLHNIAKKNMQHHAVCGLLFVVMLLVFTVNGWGQTTILSQGFESGVPPTGWANLQGGSGNLWSTLSNGSANTGSQAAEYDYNSSYAGNAWLISPGLSLASGVTYTISYYELTSGTYFPENLKVTVGTAQTIAAQTTTLQNLPSLTNSTYTQQTTTFTPGSSGTYYFAWNCYSAANMFYLNIDDILITCPAVCTPTYATLPYFQDFEAWVADPCSGGAARAPDAHWKSNIGSGSNVKNYWHRYDYAAGDWLGLTNTVGQYAPTFSHGSYSARFRNNYAPSGTEGMLDLYVDLSSAGTKTITFDYSHNEAWTTPFSFKVLLSTDGGVTFPTTLLSFGNGTPAMAFPSTQTLTTSVTSATCVLRFDATDKGLVDVGIDNLNITGCVPPIITSEPTNQTVGTGSNATFNVATSAGAPYLPMANERKWFNRMD